MYIIYMYIIYIYICIIVITVMNHSYYFVSMGCYDHPVCSTCLFATLQFIQSPFCCSPWFHCCAQEARSAILFSSDASSLSGVEFPGLMMYRGDEATENQTLSAQAAGQYIHLYIYIYMQSAKSSEAAVIMVHLLLLVHDPQKGQAVSQSNLAQIWPSGHSRWNRKKYVNCKRFDIAVELKGCYLERASHVIVGISRHPWRCDCPRQSRQGMFAWIASYTSMGA